MKKIKSTLFLWLFLFSLADASNYQQGLQLYHAQNYKEAFPIILNEAKKGNKEAQYLLGTIYQEGNGIPKDIEKSNFWYKKASSLYHYVVIDNCKASVPQNLSTKIEKQMKTSTTQQGLQQFFSKMDTTLPEVKEEVEKLVNRNFGLLPYHINYINPFGYATHKYNYHYTQYEHDQLPSKYEKNTEVEFQLSLQKVLSYDLLGLNEYISAAYTQQVWWQTYSKSAPFRETNYTPEIFMTIPSPWDNLKMVQFGYRHQSNGQDGYRSRSWNRFILSSFWQFKNLFLKTELWYKVDEDKKSEKFYQGINPNAQGDDNPDINDYLGYGNIKLQYLYGKNQFGLQIRNNLKTEHNRGAVTLDWSSPVYQSKNTYWYAKFFNGYGESLIDYDRSVTKLSFGFAFYRSLF